MSSLRTDNTIQLLRLPCISCGNLSMKKALKTSLKCFLRNPIQAFQSSVPMQDFLLLHRLRSPCPACGFLLSLPAFLHAFHFLHALHISSAIHFLFFVMGQIFPVQIIQSLRHIHIAVQINIAVGWMIILSMKI